MFTNILLAVDGSDLALNASRKAGDLARAMKSENLWVVAAFDPIPSYLGQPNRQHVITHRLDEAKSILQQAIEAVGKIPGEVHQEILEGSPAEEIINVANVRKTDLIVMGNLSQKVVNHASCPVLIVR